MESKIALFDTEGKQIGDTFMRRARQLVKQQRASWMNDDHTAIQFNVDITEEEEADETTKPSVKSGLLMLAEERLRARRQFIFHTIVLLPGFMVLLILSHALFHRNIQDFMMGALFGTWGWSYCVHAYIFYQKIKLDSRFSIFHSSENRHQIKLNAEMEKLRRMGYSD